MWGSFKENFWARSSPKEDAEPGQIQEMTKDAMKNVVTPQSIPQFIVPPLDPGHLRNPGSLDEGRKSNHLKNDSPDGKTNKLHLELPFQNIALKSSKLLIHLSV